MEWIFTLEDIDTVGQEWWKVAGDRKVFAFHGAMGAGKTTFIQHLCRLAGVRETLGSPTFSLVNEYHPAGMGGHVIWHMDLYRLRDESEAIEAGIEEYLYSGDICMVEWPGRAPGIFPPETVHVYIEALNEGLRRVRMRIGEDKP